MTARWNLLAAGLALLVLSMLVSGKAHACPPKATHVHVTHPRTCEQWRVEVKHHPRLILPRRCHAKAP